MLWRTAHQLRQLFLLLSCFQNVTTSGCGDAQPLTRAHPTHTTAPSTPTNPNLRDTASMADGNRRYAAQQQHWVRHYNNRLTFHFHYAFSFSQWPAGNTYTNHWDEPTMMVSLENRKLRGGLDLKNRVWSGARAILEEWSGQEVSELCVWLHPHLHPHPHPLMSFTSLTIILFKLL